MDNFDLVRILLSDFVLIATTFVLTMAVFFSPRKVRWHNWLHYFLLGNFVLLCMTFILFRQELPIRLFASLMLLTTLIVEVVVGKRRKLATTEQTPAT